MTDLETIKALLEKAGADISVSINPHYEDAPNPDNDMSAWDPDIDVDFGYIDITFDFDKKDHSIKSVYVSDNRTPGY